MMTDWQVTVAFAGLILFVQDPYTERITHAVLADGKDHVHQKDMPLDDPCCNELVAGDFHHRPLVWWETGRRDDPVLTQQGVLRQIGGIGGDTNPLERGEIFLRWTCPKGKKERFCGYRTESTWPDPRLVQSPPCLDSVGESGEPGACAVGPVAGNLPRLPTGEQYEPAPGGRRSFFWVPKLQSLGARETVPQESLEDWEGTPSAVFARVPLSHGQISTGDFGWMFDERRPWIPRLRFQADGRTRMERAAAEVVLWEPKAPEGATELEIFHRPFLTPNSPTLLATFKRGESPVRIVISNSPTRRCLGRPHPARSSEIAATHFETLFDLLGTDDGSNQLEADPVTPTAPVRLHPRRGCPLHGRTVVPFRPWRPEREVQQATDSEGSANTSAQRGKPYGDVGDSVGTKERPICVPAYSDG